MQPSAPRRRTLRWNTVRGLAGAVLLTFCLLALGCHPEAIAGAPAEEGTEGPPATAQETAAPRPSNTEAGDSGGETGLLPLLGVGPLANPGGCDFDDPFSSCQ